MTLSRRDLGPPWTAFALPEYEFESGNEVFLNSLGKDFIQPNPMYDILANMEAYNQSSEAERERLRHLDSQYDTIRYFVDATPDNKREHAKWAIDDDGVFHRYEDIIWKGGAKSPNLSSLLDCDRHSGV